MLELAFPLYLLFNHALLLIGRKAAVCKAPPRVRVIDCQIAKITENGGFRAGSGKKIDG
ncbi:hypothetical protein [Erythrobacter sanguineus]|uniref:Uncharacterized protein n=2 Tax=Erythrobacter sanguineus TaxID=198312 RepID=A0A1M7RY03_9SPHN|nr:hypothetical protein [Erythrobacter sanguineus]SHN51038.1 hypothetical protein SAMN02745193_00588 [Erythrobacter sanguineus]